MNLLLNMTIDLRLISNQLHMEMSLIICMISLFKIDTLRKLAETLRKLKLNGNEEKVSALLKQ